LVVRRVVGAGDGGDRELARERAPPPRPWKLVATPPLHEALNHYRLRDRLTWLRRVTRDPVSTPGADLYYVASEEEGDLPPGTRRVAFFARTGAQLRVGPSR